MKATRLPSVQECLLPIPCGGGWANTTVERNAFVIMDINTFVRMMRDRPEDCCFYVVAAHLCISCAHV